MRVRDKHNQNGVISPHVPPPHQRSAAASGSAERARTGDRGTVAKSSTGNQK